MGNQTPSPREAAQTKLFDVDALAKVWLVVADETLGVMQEGGDPGLVPPSVGSPPGEQRTLFPSLRGLTDRLAKAAVQKNPDFRYEKLSHFVGAVQWTL